MLIIMYFRFNCFKIEIESNRFIFNSRTERAALAYCAERRGFDSRRVTFVCMNMSACLGLGVFHVQTTACHAIHSQY
jgi:hypothetical protein